MGRESGSGTMDKFMRANGNWELRTDLVSGSLLRETLMKDNGS